MILHKILRKLLGWLCCMPDDDHRRRLRQPGEQVQNLQQQRVVRRPGRPRRDEWRRCYRCGNRAASAPAG